MTYTHMIENFPDTEQLYIYKENNASRSQNPHATCLCLPTLCTVVTALIPEENLAKSESSMLPESKTDFDYTIDYRKHGSLSNHWN